MRGAWNMADLGMGQAKCYRDVDIIVLRDFVREDERNLLVNLTSPARGSSRPGPQGAGTSWIASRKSWRPSRPTGGKAGSMR